LTNFQHYHSQSNGQRAQGNARQPEAAQGKHLRAVHEASSATGAQGQFQATNGGIRCGLAGESKFEYLRNF